MIPRPGMDGPTVTDNQINFFQNRNDGVEVKPLLPYGVGIDTHKEFIQVCLLLQKGTAIVRFESEFQTTWSNMEQGKAWVLTHLMHHKVPHDSTALRYTIESTGTYHMPVLLCWRGRPSVVNPMLAGPTKRKTDVLDARMLAHHAIIGMWPESFIPTREAEVLRILMNMRFEAGRNATRALNRINNHVLRFGHTFGRDFSMNDMFARGIIEDMCVGFLPKHDCVSPIGIPEDARVFFIDAYKTHKEHDLLRTKYQQLSERFLKKIDLPLEVGTIKGNKLIDHLKTVPGVGDISALTWVAVVCDPRRFQNGKQVAAFCGADPSLKVSAGKVTSHVKRKGNARLHHVLKNVAAQLVRKHNEPLGMWGYNIFRRHAKGGWARSINAVSRRLSIFLWHVHRTGTDFSWEKYKFVDVPEVVDVPLQDMGLSSRYTAMLSEAGFKSSTELSRGFFTTLPQQKGIGAGCLSKVKEWLEGNRVHPNPAKPQQSQRQVSGSSASLPDDRESISPPTRKPGKSGKKSSTRSKPSTEK